MSTTEFPTDTSSGISLFTETPFLALVIFSFVISMLIAPWSWGMLFFVLFLIVYEVAFYIVCWIRQSNKWSLEMRAGVIFASILGFIVGRVLYGEEIHEARYKTCGLKKKPLR